MHGLGASTPAACACSIYSCTCILGTYDFSSLVTSDFIFACSIHSWRTSIAIVTHNNQSFAIEPLPSPSSCDLCLAPLSFPSPPYLPTTCAEGGDVEVTAFRPRSKL